MLVVSVLCNHTNSCFFLDDDQSIYGFRGGDAKLFNKFREEFKNTNEVQLSQNYRSTQTIVNASQEVIKVNQQRSQKNIFSSLAKGEQITLVCMATPEEEIEYVVGKVPI